VSARTPPDFAAAVEARYPGLIAAARAVIERSEREFSGERVGRAGGASRGVRAERDGSRSYLWEHTSHVAALSYRLALAEGHDPVLAAVAGLFHDAGKFAGGAYHHGDKAEEETAAEIAAPLLRAAGRSARDAKRVTGALRSLYAAPTRAGASSTTAAPIKLSARTGLIGSTATTRSALAAIVHDADFLAKFGTLGVAQFFIKSTLRGRTLLDAILGPLSKELTYAAALPRNMRTAAGRRAAVRKAKDTQAYFRALLRELREAQSADLRIRTFRVAPAGSGKATLDVVLALPRACEGCGGRPEIAFRREQGTKCETLEAESACPSCGRRTSLSFCLPEIDRQ
jgi:HD superfamily phosphodiesterase